MTKWKGWKAVIRDLIIIWILTGLGGFIIGVASSASELPLALIGISTIILGIIGFFIYGCMVEEKRWKHLFIVAVFVWLTSIINILLSQFSLINWMFGIIQILIMMGIGGGLSFIFKKPLKIQ